MHLKGAWALCLAAAVGCGRTGLLDELAEPAAELPGTDGGGPQGTPDAGVSTLDAGRGDGGTADAGASTRDGGVDGGAPLDGGAPGPGPDPGAESYWSACAGRPVDEVIFVNCPGRSEEHCSMSLPGSRVTRVVVPRGTRRGELRIHEPQPDVVCILIEGEIVGAGGNGGHGGNGGSGIGPRPCARPGQPGGRALSVLGGLQVHITVSGLVAGGGGGGEGVSGCNQNGGGSGGGGLPPGLAGAGQSALSREDELAYCGQDNGERWGQVGLPGTTTAGGPAQLLGLGTLTGAGGEPGQPGGLASGCGVRNNAPAAPGVAIEVETAPVVSVQTSGSGRVLGRVIHR